MSDARSTVADMDVLLIPGLWLDASSWRDITPALEAASHTPHALTMPGTGSSGADSAEIGIVDWVDAVVAEIDALDGPVALVGHSGGGNVVWAAAAQRPQRVARVVFVDTVPPPPGRGISEFEIVDGVVPFPGWDFFDTEEVADLDEETRAEWAARTASVPARVPTDPLPLDGDGRFGVPVTVLSGSMDEDAFRAAVKDWGPWGDEFAAIRDAEVVRLGSGHWPQFSQPQHLAGVIVDALR
ncbi:esterase [Microbacterium terricola]|uniref:Esterase n=2 Tax=Microbacterium terricola TaxID=344163 RepID=A0ABM8DXT8_9MICO|nr:esterase [Microbacterium terricola]